MELDYLCEFTVVARLCSYSQAAEELNLSQSSLSKHIIALERELDVRLFERTSRRVTLSAAGEILLPYAENALALRDGITAAALEYVRIGRASLRIASIPVMAHYDITGVIAEFMRLHTEIKLTVTECESRDILHLLRAGEYDLAFTRKTGGGEQGLEYRTFCSDQLVAVLPRTHRLAGRETVGLRELMGEEFLFLDKSTELYSLCVKLCEDADFSPKVRYTGHRPENITDLVSRGMGVSLLMRRHAEYIMNPGVAYVGVSPNVNSEICLVRVEGKKMSRPAKLFWERIADNR